MSNRTLVAGARVRWQDRKRTERDHWQDWAIATSQTYETRAFRSSNHWLSNSAWQNGCWQPVSGGCVIRQSYRVTSQFSPATFHHISRIKL